MSIKTTHQPAIVFTLILLVIFCPLGIDLYLPAFIDMQSALSVNESQVQQTVSIYMATVGLGQLIAGPLADKYGRKPIALIGMCIYLAGAALAWLSAEWLYIMLARALQGFGACATFVSAFAIVRDSYNKRASAQALTYLNGVVCFIPALAPILGAWLTQTFGWRSNFLFLACFAFLGVVICASLFKETKPNNSIYQGHIFDLRRFLPILKDKTFSFYACIPMISMSTILVFVTTAPHWIMTELNLSMNEFTIWFGFNAAISIVASFIAPKLIKHSPHSALLFGLSLFILAGIALIFGSQFKHVYAYMLPVIVISVGFAYVLGSSSGIALSDYAQQAGTASALIGVLQMSGAAVLAYLSQTLQLIAPLQIALHCFLALPFILMLFINKALTPSVKS